MNMSHAGYPRHRENRENGNKKSLSEKTQGIRKFLPISGNSQGILFAQVVNSLMPKVNHIAIFAGKIFIFSRSWMGLLSQFCVCIVPNYGN